MPKYTWGTAALAVNPAGIAAGRFADELGAFVPGAAVLAHDVQQLAALAELMAPPQVTVLLDVATPTVLGIGLAGKMGFVVSGGTTPITDFNDGVVGQVFTLLSAHALTITDGANIPLKGSVDFVMAAGDTLTLAMVNDQVWEEISRKVNL